MLLALLTTADPPLFRVTSWMSFQLHNFASSKFSAHPSMVFPPLPSNVPIESSTSLNVSNVTLLLTTSCIPFSLSNPRFLSRCRQKNYRLFVPPQTLLSRGVLLSRFWHRSSSFFVFLHLYCRHPPLTSQFWSIASLFLRMYNRMSPQYLINSWLSRFHLALIFSEQESCGTPMHIFTPEVHHRAIFTSRPINASWPECGIIASLASTLAIYQHAARNISLRAEFRADLPFSSFKLLQQGEPTTRAVASSSRGERTRVYTAKYQAASPERKEGRERSFVSFILRSKEINTVWILIAKRDNRPRAAYVHTLFLFLDISSFRSFLKLIAHTRVRFLRRQVRHFWPRDSLIIEELIANLSVLLPKNHSPPRACRCFKRKRERERKQEEWEAALAPKVSVSGKSRSFRANTVNKSRLGSFTILNSCIRIFDIRNQTVTPRRREGEEGLSLFFSSFVTRWIETAASDEANPLS